MVMPHIGGGELILILAIILIIFGVGKLPQVGGAIGKGLREFRKGQQGIGEEEVDESSSTKAAAKKKTATKEKAAAKKKGG